MKRSKKKKSRRQPFAQQAHEEDQLLPAWLRYLIIILLSLALISGLFSRSGPVALRFPVHQPAR